MGGCRPLLFAAAVGMAVWVGDRLSSTERHASRRYKLLDGWIRDLVPSRSAFFRGALPRFRGRYARRLPASGDPVEAFPLGSRPDTVGVSPCRLRIAVRSALPGLVSCSVRTPFRAELSCSVAAVHCAGPPVTLAARRVSGPGVFFSVVPIGTCCSAPAADSPSRWLRPPLRGELPVRSPFAFGGPVAGMTTRVAARCRRDGLLPGASLESCCRRRRWVFDRRRAARCAGGIPTCRELRRVRCLG